MTLTCNEAKKCCNFCCVECIAELDRCVVPLRMFGSRPCLSEMSPTALQLRPNDSGDGPHALTKTITVKYRTNVTDREVEKLPTRDLTSSDLLLKMLA